MIPDATTTMAITTTATLSIIYVILTKKLLPFNSLAAINIQELDWRRGLSVDWPTIYT